MSWGDNYLNDLEGINIIILSEKSIPLFKGNYFESKLKLEKVVKEKDDIIQVHYSVIK